MRTNDVTLVSANDADFEELVALRIATMQESLERLGRFDIERARERFRAGFSPAYTRHILVGEARVGFVVVKPHEGDLLLDHLYIRIEHQNQGIGAAVLARVFAEADASKLRLRVGALRDSEANRFYQRHGFVKSDEGPWDIYYIRCPVAS